MTEKQKQAFRKCGISPEEMEDVLRCDKEIDRGEKLFELDPELEAGAKKARQADRKPTERKPKEKKQDEDKQALIAAMVDKLTINSGCKPFADSGSMVVTNPEREFLFTMNGKKYKVVLSCPRN